MARHRNFRKLNYDEECDFDDVYGRSVEEELCISPNTAAEFLYDRGSKSTNMSAYFSHEENIPEEVQKPTEKLQKEKFERQLNDIDKARLNSCIDEIRSVIGELVPEKEMVEIIIKNDFDINKSVDAVLVNHSQNSQKEEPKPQRQRKERRRNAGQEVNSSGIVHPLNGEMGELQHRLNQVQPTSVNITKGFSPEADSLPVPKLRNEKSPSPTVEMENNVLEKTEEKESSLNQKTTSKLKETSSSNTNSTSKLDPVAEYQRQRGHTKELLNLVVIGHVDAGKSTLMGHLLCLMGAVSQKTMHKYEQESKKIGKSSFAFAWVLDETGEERSRGITMDVGQFKFETPTKIVTLLDAPGHKDFIPNMITGASQADVAILVVDATRGEFETGFESGGQTREHALLVRSLGVCQLVVAVNKLDTVNWSQDRFQDIRKKLSSFLKQAGFKESDVSYVPCSGLTGENLKNPPTVENLCSWYKGPTLLQQIDVFKSPPRPVSKPFRMSVNDVFKGQGSGFSVAGRVETGIVANTDKVLVMPQGELAQVKGISTDDVSVTNAFAGDSAILTLSNIDMANVAVGCILCHSINPIRTTTRFQARIVIFNIEVPITKGFPVVLHYQSLSEAAIIKKLISQLHKSTGEVVKKKPRCLGKQTSALIEIEMTRPICIELYKDIKELGRFMLRSSGHTIAAGLVTEIL